MLKLKIFNTSWDNYYWKVMDKFKEGKKGGSSLTLVILNSFPSTVNTGIE